MKQRAAPSLRSVLLLQGKLVALSAQDPGDRGLCRAPQQGDTSGDISPMSVVPLFAK